MIGMFHELPISEWSHYSTASIYKNINREHPQSKCEVLVGMQPLRSDTNVMHQYTLCAHPM